MVRNHHQGQQTPPSEEAPHASLDSPDALDVGQHRFLFLLLIGGKWWIECDTPEQRFDILFGHFVGVAYNRRPKVQTELVQVSDIEQQHVLVVAKRQETGSGVKGRVHFVVVQHGADRAPALENVGRGALHGRKWMLLR